MDEKKTIVQNDAEALSSQISKRQSAAELADMQDRKVYYKAPEDFELIGTNYHRVDAELKVTGKAKYTGDIMLPEMLCGKFVRSPHPHAKILSIDTSEAEKLPGVRGIITGADFQWGKLGNAEFARVFADKPGLAQEKVRGIGDEVAAVAALDEATAARACELIRVEYEVLPAVFDPVEAMEDSAPAIHAPGRHNIGMLSAMKAGGDTEAAFAIADYTDRHQYATQMIVHGALEPHAAVAKFENDEYTIWTSTQTAFVTQFWAANALGVPESQVRVIKPYLGGGFGGKLDTWPHEVCAALLAKKTGKPVRFVLTREEVFYGTKVRHPIFFDIQSAFTKDGEMLAKKCTHILDGGCYGGSGVAACAQSLIWANLPYKIPAVNMVAKRVYTNNPSAGAMRGYGSCQVHFANEVHMDTVAEELGIDEVELRKINGATPNYDSPSGLKITSCAFRETLDAAAAAIKWEEQKKKLPKGEGIGFAGSGFVSGTGFPILETPKYTSGNVLVRVNRYGYATLYTGSNDIGQGSDTVMTMITAEELGIGMNEVKLFQSDTSATPFDSGTYGSRVTFLTGNAVRNAAVDAKRKLLEAAGEKWGVDPHSLKLKGHRVFSQEDAALTMSLSDCAVYYMQNHNGEEVTGVGAYFHDVDPKLYHGDHNGNFAPSYSFSTGAAKVCVDEETGAVDISDFIFAHDCGRPLNLRAVEGQLEGSVQMGLGYAMLEHCIVENGKIKNPSFRDYRFPTALDMPQIQTILCGPEDPDGPMGAKECGEGSTAPVAPAIVNAVNKATGLHITSIPITPEAIWKAMKEKEAAGK